MNAQESIDFAKKYLEDVISFFEINADVEVDCHDDVIELAVSSPDLNSILIGKNAETLRSLQYVISTTLRNKNAALTR
ncbi:MAG: single-stranded DNA-binding protein, partial [Candidatus Saccharimonadales bacterium]